MKKYAIKFKALISPAAFIAPLSIALALVLFTANISAFTAETKKNILVLAYSTVESFPDTTGDGTVVASPPGISAELISEAAGELGLEVRFVRFPNIRVLKHLELGEVDGAFLYSFKEERMACGRYPSKDGKTDGGRKLTSHGYYIYTGTDSAILWDGQKFTNLNDTVGVNLGYSIADDLRKMGIKVEESVTTEQNLKKLENKRIAAYISENTIVVDHYLKTGKYSNISKLPIPFVPPKDYFLMFSHRFFKDNAETAEKLWTIIGRIREARTKELIPKYLRLLE